MTPTQQAIDARKRRLVAELAEVGLDLDRTDPEHALVIDEVDYALRPHMHERKVFSVGAIIEPRIEPAQWDVGTSLSINHRRSGDMPIVGARRFADGLSSWLVRRVDGTDEWAVFERPAGSERDLVVLAEALGATVVQRHPTGAVRIVGDFGVLRWEGRTWHHEPPLRAWVDSIAACPTHGERQVLDLLLQFAVHDLGTRGIGAILVYQPDVEPESFFELRLPTPPPLRIYSPFDLAPLRHSLAQVDGAAVFDESGVLRQLGVRLVPSRKAESEIEGYRGMRHTAGRRYSFDDPTATIIVVSADGPVTVMRNGNLVGASPAPDD